MQLRQHSTQCLQAGIWPVQVIEEKSVAATSNAGRSVSCRGAVSYRGDWLADHSCPTLQQADCHIRGNAGGRRDTHALRHAPDCFSESAFVRLLFSPAVANVRQQNSPLPPIPFLLRIAFLFQSSDRTCQVRSGPAQRRAPFKRCFPSGDSRSRSIVSSPPN